MTATRIPPDLRRDVVVILRNILSVVSLLFLAAHGLRTGSSAMALYWVLAASLVFASWDWRHLALAGLLGFGSSLWGDIALNLIQQRQAAGLPWLRLAIILGVVAGVCLLAAVLQVRAALSPQKRYSVAPGAAFLLTTGGLALARQKSSLTIILADRFIHDGGWLVILLLGVYAAIITSRMRDSRFTAKYRRLIWTLFSAVFFTQLLLGLLGLERFLMTGALHLPVPALIAAGPIYRGEGLFMIILFAVTILLVGPAWCSHLCYIGAWDNLAAQAGRKASQLSPWTKTMRWVIAVAVMLLALLLGRSGLPVTLAVMLAAAFGLVGVGLMLVWSRRTGTMTHCIAYCPMGLLANIFGRINPWRIRVGDGCNQCGRCSRICRYNALAESDLAQHRAGFTCTLCGDCLSSCPQQHLHYHFPGLSPELARTIFLVMVVSLHAIFLGVARL